MYNVDNTIVSYPDPRGIETRGAHNSGQSYHGSNQPQFYASPIRNTLYTTYGAQGVIEPQSQMNKHLTTNHYTHSSSSRKFQTMVGMESKQALTQEEPITKVTTTKQVYYPAVYADKQETLEFSEKAQELRPTLTKLPTYVPTQRPEPVYSNPEYEYDKDYEVTYNQYRSTSAPRGRVRKSKKTKKIDKYHSSHYVSPVRTYVSPVRNYVA
jgi:hypothetical protein